MLIRDAELAGRVVDVRVAGGRIVEVGAGLALAAGEASLSAEGGALLPGLHDHHLHLHALAAALASVRCGPPEVTDVDALARALAAPPDRQGWLRGIGYFESVAGPLDRTLLDRLRDDVPVRIQHRSGAMWFLNSRAVEALGLDTLAPEARGIGAAEDGIERDTDGRATGRLFRADPWLHEHLPRSLAPDLSRVGHLLASYGVTTVTDATPNNGPAEAARFAAAHASGALPQRVLMMGRLAVERSAEDRSASQRAGVRVAAHKIMLDEPALPDLDRLIDAIRAAHADARPVAIHTVTRAEIHFALAALEAAGTRLGDRLEHASIAPPEAIEVVKRLALTIVTQPNFVAERGDAYQANVEARDLPHLYRVKSWLGAGVATGGGTDAPFGAPDPWRSMRAAVDRRTPDGAVLGPEERVSPETALALFLPTFARAEQPANETAPTVEVGRPADLCLLRRPWREARRALSSDDVAATWCDGRLVYSTSLSAS